MEIVLRKTNINDADKLLSFFGELKNENAQVSFSEIDSLELIDKWINNDKIYSFIAEKNNKIVAVLGAKRGKENWRDHSCFLTAAVNSKYRGQGIARELTLFSLNELKKENIKIARAYIYSDNIPSINTILKCGFTMSGSVYMHHYSEKQNMYIDDLIFYKLLT